MRSAIFAECSVGQGERLVVSVRVDRLCAARDRRKRLDRHAHDVVLRLLSRQRRAARLRVEAERERPRVRRAEPLSHDLGPEAPGRAELCDLLEEVVVGIEEEGEALAEVVGRQPRVDRRLRVGDPVGEGERELLRRRRPRLADVVPGDRDRVPLRQPLRAVREQVGRDSHRRTRRVDVVPACAVLLEDVVLHRAAKSFGRDSLLLGDELVEQEQQRGGRVDRHRRGHLAERDRLEEQLHVRDRVDRDAGAPDLAFRAWIVRVVPELRREVERDAQACLAALEQVAKALVRLLRRREPGVLADRPRPASVHVRVRAARERELTRTLELSLDVVGRIDRLHLDPGVGLARVGRRHASIVETERRRVPRSSRPPGAGSHGKPGENAGASPLQRSYPRFPRSNP